MDEHLIMGMVDPYIREKTLTYNDFEEIFSMLSKKEQYEITEILYKNKIELIDGNDYNEDGFEIRYDDALFSGNEVKADCRAELDNIGPKQGHQIVRRDVLLSNRALIQMIQKGDAQAKQDLCVKNQGLVDKLAGIYQRMFVNKLEFEDLEQAGMMGMIKAAEKFDLNAGTEFSTYAVWWIKQGITREIADYGYTIRIPVHRMDQLLKVMRLDAKFFEVEDFNKRMDLISQEAELPKNLVEECIRLYYQFIKVTSLDLPVGEDENVTLVELIPCEEELSVEGIAAQRILRENLDEVLKTLTPREEKIIRMRFGLDDGSAKTLEQLGEELGVTRERIRQIESQALKKLRHPSRSKKLKDFLE
uniref:sigma-70 family RNA polymerase sigma factor n=1 Tax=Eubacterium cellulosolvens TaxID=29322 RepID=UPI000AA1E011|nr:sigma-70 family RNA polymerase sigma factor [[Eubacterium] cellulosolvens]